MKQTINFYDFERAFVDMGRQDQFSYEGKKALFEWFEQLDEDCGTETELDVIAICCEFTEYDSWAEFQDNYGDEYDIDTLNDHTFVIEIGRGSFIVQDF